MFIELLQLKGKVNGMVFLVEDKQDNKTVVTVYE
jgi:hypothetical protein